MNLAYSSHEIISDFTTAAFVWLESGCGAAEGPCHRRLLPRRAAAALCGGAAGHIAGSGRSVKAWLACLAVPANLLPKSTLLVSVSLAEAQETLSGWLMSMRQLAAASWAMPPGPSSRRQLLWARRRRLPPSRWLPGWHELLSSRRRRHSRNSPQRSSKPLEACSWAGACPQP